VFHAKRDRATNANAHLAHLQAQTHMLTLPLAKEPNFSRRSKIMITYLENLLEFAIRLISLLKMQRYL